MELIYTDSQKNKWYKYKNPATMPNVRNLEAQIKAREARMGIMDESLKEMIKKAKEFGNKGNIVDLFSIIKEIELRLDNINDTEILLSLATVYFCLNDENPSTFNRSIQAEKRRIWEEDSECRGFFLCEAFRLTYNYSNISKEDILRLLAEDEKRKQIFAKVFKM